MEKYQGVKFRYQSSNNTFFYDHRLTTLNHWVYLFSQLGLTPVHSGGAYGNQSFRTSSSSFIITKAGMIPEEQLITENYSHVIQLEESKNVFITEGLSAPSSECLLHYGLYNALPEIKAIMHGHSQLLNIYAAALNIPVTKSFYPYGTKELAQSAIEMMDGRIRFFILKDHGFVALGNDINDAGKLTLDYFSKLIRILQSL